MTYLSRATAAAGVLLAATGLLAAGPAQAASRDHAPGNWLHLTVTKGDTGAGDPRGTLLLCDPPRGHAHAAEACAELAAADGDIGRIPPKDVFCPMLYAPVTAHARGRWNGRPVDFRQTYTNACALNARTGEVFALDQ
ncbi:SSI family serine proteinase inhibitor [Streptomyces sp. MMG1121]|uniref:SSI family serine proteinase inhibitor n=1 Tax=Streptomyces sp. MMG1121 TaxID=1415544 RepID=UPI0006AE5269|nr:SSI family serine proteinase inhibitor [Streptomyces sp. MMG1121]KOV69285.1 serine protease [Streptomyces sp. MMG1121]